MAPLLSASCVKDGDRDKDRDKDGDGEVRELRGELGQLRGELRELSEEVRGELGAMRRGLDELLLLLKERAATKSSGAEASSSLHAAQCRPPSRERGGLPRVQPMPMYSMLIRRDSLGVCTLNKALIPCFPVGFVQ
eukprot:gene38532-46837_t